MTTELEKSSPAATTFKLEAELLDQGRTMDLLARSGVLAAHIKVYAEGGENAMHAHTQEDHLFVVLGGEATFHLGSDDNISVLASTKASSFRPVASTGSSVAATRT